MAIDNSFRLSGRLGTDVETKRTGNGVAVSTLNIATNRRAKKEGSEEYEEVTQWHRVQLWRRDGLLPYLTKGTEVEVVGYLNPRKYEKDGETKYVLDLVADDIKVHFGERGGRQAEVGNKGKAASTEDDPWS